MKCRISLSAGFLLLAATLAAGTPIVYDGSTFPEDQGWERDPSSNALRAVEDGWFVQSLRLYEGPPLHGETDAYRISIAQYAGTSGFSAEWRMMTDGPSTEMDMVAPAVVSLYGNGSVFYSFVIADDLVRLFRQDLNFTYFDITPGVPHTYRVHVLDEWFRLFIDDMLVMEADQGGPYPTDTSRILFSGRSFEHENVNRWDYISFSTIPEPASGVLLALGCLVCGRRRLGRPTEIHR